MVQKNSLRWTNLGHEVEDAVEEHIDCRATRDDEGPPPPVVVLTDNQPCNNHNNYNKLILRKF